jgi:hypothetical protein
MANQKTPQQAWQEIVDNYSTLSLNMQQELGQFLQTGSLSGLSPAAQRVIQTALNGTGYITPGKVQPLAAVAKQFWSDVRGNGGAVTGGAVPAGSATTGSTVTPAVPQRLGGGDMPAGTYPAGRVIGNGVPVGQGQQAVPGGIGSVSQFVHRLLAGSPLQTGSTVDGPAQTIGNQIGFLGSQPEGGKMPPPAPTGGGVEGGPMTTPSAPTQTGGQRTGTTDRNSPGYPGNAAATVPGAATVGSQIGTGVGGSFTTALADKLAADPQAMMNVALQRLGYAPDRPGQVGTFLASIMGPAFAAQQQLGGFQPGNNPMQYDNMNVANDTMGLSGQFLKPGVDASAQVRGLANNALANPTFMSMLGNPGGDNPLQNQLQMLGFLEQTRTNGLNPLVQSATEAALNQAATRYNMGSLGELNGGSKMPVNFLDWLKTQPPEVQKMILGG